MKLQRLFHLFNQSTFPKSMRWSSHRLSKSLHTFRVLLILILWNVLLIPMEFAFSNFIDYRTISNLFMINIILEQTLLCAITKVQRATKISVAFVGNFIMKVKRGFSVHLLRYGSMKIVLEIPKYVWSSYIYMYIYIYVLFIYMYMLLHIYYLYICICYMLYIYIFQSHLNMCSINKKIVLKTNLLSKIFRFLYRSFVGIMAYIYMIYLKLVTHLKLAFVLIYNIYIYVIYIIYISVFERYAT